MAAGVDTDLWLQSRRIAVIEGRTAALDEIRLRLIEMSDTSSAKSVAARIEELQKDSAYQRNVLVAMRARIAVRRVEQTVADKPQPGRAAVAALSRC